MTTAADSRSLRDSTEMVVERFGRAATVLVDGKWWAVRVGVFVSLVSFVIQAPALEIKRAFFESVVAQGAHPFTPIHANPISHQSKLAFRLVPPLLVRFGHLSPESYYVVQAVLGVATLSLLAWLFHNVGYSRRVSLALVLALGFTYIGSVWFIDWQPYFDAIAASTLVLAMAVRHPALVAVGISLALWTDERAILAALVVAAWHIHRRNRSGAVAVAVALIAYAALRAFLGHHYGLSTGRTEVGFHVLHKYFSTMPIALVLSLEGLWLLLCAGLARAWLDRRWTALPVAICAAGSALTAVVVDDVTRSTVYLLPAVVLAAAYLIEESERTRTALAGVCLTLCFVVPTTSVVAAGFSMFYPLPLRLFL